MALFRTRVLENYVLSMPDCSRDPRPGAGSLAVKMLGKGTLLAGWSASDRPPLAEVRPFGWTDLGECFDRLPGVLVFERRGFHATQVSPRHRPKP